MQHLAWLGPRCQSEEVDSETVNLCGELGEGVEEVFLCRPVKPRMTTFTLLLIPELTRAASREPGLAVSHS